VNFHLFGDPDGIPLIYFHGLPSSGDEGALLHETALLQAVKVLAPDRPGFGQSPPQPGRSLMSTAQAVAQALQDRGERRYAVAGCSGGGPYALALAAAAPDAVRFAAPIAGMYPFRSWRDLAGMHWNNRLVFYLARTRPQWIRPLFNISLTRIRRDSRKAYYDSLKLLPAEDAGFFSLPEVAEVMQRAMENSMQQGCEAAMVETQLFARDWQIDLARIRCPVIGWHGQQDSAVPLAMAQGFFNDAKKIAPQCQLITLASAHISTLKNVLDDEGFWRAVKGE